MRTDRRKFRSLFSDNINRGGAEDQRRERLEERRSEVRKSQKKEDAGVREGRKFTRHRVFFPMI